MSRITKSATRDIIDDFANEIRVKQSDTVKPSKTVINFRTDRKDGNERPIKRVPIEILRYRKENGRISSDVLDYENNFGFLNESDEKDQAKLAEFLRLKDPEKTEALKKSLLHSGQLEPAIITCDGFLINGNRRKMAMELLKQEYRQNEDFGYMKVVILPGKNEPGGPPTLLEIEKLENRYQLQSDGKSEYYGFDRALSIKRKIQLGLTLEEQLLDDPLYVDANKSELEKAVKDSEKEYLHPLDCVDRYLRQFRRDGQYRTISSGATDPAGRWYAFRDYSNTYQRHFNNPKRLIELGIEDDEIGEIEEAAFDIIRLRNIQDMPKVHQIMRDLPKYCATLEGKREVLKIAEEVEAVLPPDKCFDENGNPLSVEDVDARWAAENRQNIIHRIKKARKTHERKMEKETPLTLLEAAFKKLNHEKMDLNAITYDDCEKARNYCQNIIDRASDLNSEIFENEKKLKKLPKKKS